MYLTTIETIKVPNNYTGWDEYKKDKPSIGGHMVTAQELRQSIKN